MWNWKKIEGIETLPKFDRPVVLYQKKGEKKYALIGWLTAIDANGARWSYNNSIDLFNLFNFATPAKDDDKTFKPTHWCDIEPPQDEEEKTKA